MDDLTPQQKEEFKRMLDKRIQVRKQRRSLAPFTLVTSLIMLSIATALGVQMFMRPVDTYHQTWFILFSIGGIVLLLGAIAGFQEK